MKLSPPKQLTFWISVILATLGVLGRYLNLPFVSENFFYLTLVGYIVLFLGNILKGF